MTDRDCELDRQTVAEKVSRLRLDLPRFTIGDDLGRMDRRPTTLYRFYDRDGCLLYVGISSDGHRRMREHRRNREWWPEVHKATFRHYPNRTSALRAERRAIRWEEPRYNNRYATTEPDQPRIPPDTKQQRMFAGVLTKLVGFEMDTSRPLHPSEMRTIQEEFENWLVELAYIYHATDDEQIHARIESAVDLVIETLRNVRPLFEESA